MGETSTDPFSSRGGVDHIACINNWMQLAELADHYICSGDALVTAALEDHTLLDVHVQPACFLYRHGLELLLKDFAWKSHYLATGTRRFAQKDWQELGRHGLSTIWDSARVAAETVLGADFPLNSGGANEVTSCLSQIEDHDPDSYSFRYPISKRKGRTHPQLTSVNLVALRERVRETFGQIAAVLGMIEYCLSAEQ